MTDQHYHIGNIRVLLTEGFGERELRNLCRDVPDFRPVYKELSRSASSVEIADLLIEHCEKKVLMPTLLELARERNLFLYILRWRFERKNKIA